MEDKEQGILCRKDRTFYYLETGPASARNRIDRLRGILLNRGLITYHKTDPNDRKDSYEIISVEEAKDKGVPIEVIYLTKHIEKVMKAEAEEQKKKVGVWGT